jgi:hypothetical protein
LSWKNLQEIGASYQIPYSPDKLWGLEMYRVIVIEVSAIAVARLTSFCCATAILMQGTDELAYTSVAHFMSKKSGIGTKLKK